MGQGQGGLVTRSFFQRVLQGQGFHLLAFNRASANSQFKELGFLQDGTDVIKLCEGFIRSKTFKTAVQRFAVAFAVAGR